MLSSTVVTLQGSSGRSPARPLTDPTTTSPGQPEAHVLQVVAPRQCAGQSLARSRGSGQVFNHPICRTGPHSLVRCCVAHLRLHPLGRATSFSKHQAQIPSSRARQAAPQPEPQIEPLHARCPLGGPLAPRPACPPVARSPVNVALRSSDPRR
ncbi:hypothetical protein NDU88_003619 [Pleurodeles waltl]|uniref:Uncharacterized protein n=1 Tax=Pleurodeles waltl TaxID=8319 RepID=A0AAV7MR43_PLEWA|nr:hypothetical protein NDU88_003619 [Pleurodeles waltl]